MQRLQFDVLADVKRRLPSPMTKFETVAVDAVDFVVVVAVDDLLGRCCKGRR